MSYNDLPNVIKSRIEAYNVPMTYIADASDQQIREYFRFLQNQERLRAGELINSMPATNLEELLDGIKDKDTFLDVIGFVDDRAEFEKIFYSLIGLFDEKLSFGTTDKSIQNYAARACTPTVGMENTLNMINQINVIAQLSDFNLESRRKRFLKYLLLLCGFGFVDFSIDTNKKLLALKQIDEKLFVFFSAKANVVENEFIGYSNEVIEEYRYIALLTKGGHSLKRVENRMRILAYYVENINHKTVSSDITLIEEE